MTLASMLLAALPAALVAQSDPVAESRARSQAAIRAYEARDLPAFLEHAREAQALRPAHGGASWALAAALALNGDTAGAIEMLHHFAALGYWADPGSEPDFAEVRSTEPTRSWPADWSGIASRW